MAGGSLNVKHLWIQGGGGDPALVNESTPEYPGQVGKIGTIKAAAGVVPVVLQFVKRVATDTTVAATSYALAYWQDQDDFVVCADQTLAVGGSTYPAVAGVFLGSYPAAGSYGFIKVGGSAVVKLDGVETADVAAGEKIFAKAADSDGLSYHKGAAGTDATTIAVELLVTNQQQVGVALAAQADSSGSVAVLLTVPRNGW
jgi:hypothetical protein